MVEDAVSKILGAVRGMDAGEVRALMRGPLEYAAHVFQGECDEVRRHLGSGFPADPDADLTLCFRRFVLWTLQTPDAVSPGTPEAYRASWAAWNLLTDKWHASDITHHLGYPGAGVTADWLGLFG